MDELKMQVNLKGPLLRTFLDYIGKTTTQRDRGAYSITLRNALREYLEKRGFPVEQSQSPDVKVPV